jgi:hypothetical protein
MAIEKEFWELAENWYRRTHKLREVAENNNETPERKKKAKKLFLIMVYRMMRLKTMSIKIRTPKTPINFKPGGII